MCKVDNKWESWDERWREKLPQLRVDGWTGYGIQFELISFVTAVNSFIKLRARLDYIQKKGQKYQIEIT